MFQLRELVLHSHRERVMAHLARTIGRGHDAIYHGTRHLSPVLRTGVLLPPSVGDLAVFFTRSPEVAAYWANMIVEKRDQLCGGILVLNRSSLVHTYRLEPSRYTVDWDDEREEAVWHRRINIRRHLLGVVRHRDVDNIITSRPGALLREGRAKVREIIVRQRETTFLNAYTP